MRIEMIAALIWRFLGVIAIVSALPSFTAWIFGAIRSVGAMGIGYYLLNAQNVLVLVLTSLSIVCGILLLAYSKPLGRRISKGLGEGGE